MEKKLTFQDIILTLQEYWSANGCSILQPYDLRVGAGTFHPATLLKCLGDKPQRIVYVQPCRRPTDSRFGDHPNRYQKYYQLQVILKPSPDNVQELYLNSLAMLGLDRKNNDIRFVEDNWESPSLGASGYGWEIWCNGMEISQFTYFQKLAGLNLTTVSAEITYGLERLALYIQKVRDFKEITWSLNDIGEKITYDQIEGYNEDQFSRYNLYEADVEYLKRNFLDLSKQCKDLVQKQLPLVAYELCVETSHIFNLLQARGVISVTEREKYVENIRDLAKMCANSFLAQENKYD